MYTNNTSKYQTKQYICVHVRVCIYTHIHTYGYIYAQDLITKLLLKTLNNCNADL